jgi:formylglycine-generating enzyme required for sulfatase activity
MKYEAKAWADTSANGQIDPGEIVANGCGGTGNYCEGKTSNWGPYVHKPVSVEEGKPWRKIGRDNAVFECQSLGQGYDLISNSEWQTIARNIENQGANWSGQKVGAGCIFQGNIYAESAYKTCSYTVNGPESGGNRRAKHVLSNGEEIYHFSGNVWEWGKDNNTDDYDGSGYIAFLKNDSAKLRFGPQGYYASCNYLQNNFCGLGVGIFYESSGALLRGGGWADDYDVAGVFATLRNVDPSASSGNVGFRCVFHFQSSGGTGGDFHE